MVELDAPVERTVIRRVFEAWSVEIPATFAETFNEDDSYWHAFDDERSVSLSSIVLSDAVGPVSAERILRELPSLDGEPVGDCRRGSSGGLRPVRPSSLRSPRRRCPVWSRSMGGC